MSTIKILGTIQSFLQEKVSPTIKLQKPTDNNVDNYELVYPQIHIGWIPPKGFIPPEMDTGIPCLIVGMDDANDDGKEGEIAIRISAVVYSPGAHVPDGEGNIVFTPDYNGYNDLLNLIDRTVAELMRNRIIKNVATVQMPVKWGIYQQEQPYPYWYGYITFSVSKQSLVCTTDLQNLL